MNKLKNTPSLPEIRIKDGWLIRNNISVHLHELWGKDSELADDNEMREIVENYIKAWKPYEKQILTGLTEITGLSFRQNIIDVYIAPWFTAFSDPMVIGVVYKPDLFVDILTHELIHRLLTDNLSTPYNYQLVAEWKKLFGRQHDWNTLVHIPVHAINEAIYMDVLKSPKRLERDLKRCSKFSTGYKEAWDYVEAHGYQKIIKQLRRSYEEIAKKTN